MKAYLVSSLSKIDYDFSVYEGYHGVFFDEKKAIEKAKEEFEKLKVENADDIKRYSNEEEYRDISEGALIIEEDPEYYYMSYGFEEHYEMHSVSVNEVEIKDLLTETNLYDIYREMKREYLLEDIKAKAKEEDIDLSDKDVDDLIDRAEKVLSHNDGFWESYWLSIEESLKTDD